MNNVQVLLDPRNFLATPITSQDTVLIDLQFAVVNFTVLDKIFNLSMRNEEEKRAFALFLHLLDKKEVSAIIDGKYANHCIHKGDNDLSVLTATHHTSRLIIMDTLTPFWAAAFRILLPLRKNGWFPFTVPSAT